MTIEFVALIVAALLGFAHIIAASHAASVERGYRWTAGSRDAPLQPLTGFAGRLARASANFKETFAYYVTGVVLVSVTHSASAATAWAAWIYVAARFAYWIAYASGVFLWRSLIWNVATFAILALLLAPVVPYW